MEGRRDRVTLSCPGVKGEEERRVGFPLPLNIMADACENNCLPFLALRKVVGKN